MTIQEALEVAGVERVKRGMRAFAVEYHSCTAQCVVGYMRNGEPGDYADMVIEIGSPAMTLSDAFEESNTNRAALEQDCIQFLAENGSAAEPSPQPHDCA